MRYLLYVAVLTILHSVPASPSQKCWILLGGNGYTIVATAGLWKMEEVMFNVQVVPLLQSSN